jgi:YgiT-type zinc finger domain-containing protein
MSDTDGGEACPFCKPGHMVKVTRQMTFRQVTDRGRVFCRVAVPVRICPRCGFEMLDADAEATMDQAVRREYAKLLRTPGRDGRGRGCARPKRKR